ncbi:MAG: hypothetical protein IJW28_04035, partial [Clostridia bacterium]|nr:hypothetical protein [Clostridia bacterium]
ISGDAINEGFVHTESEYVGGFIGYTKGNVTIDGTTKNTANSVNSAAVKGKNYVGGIIGYGYSADDSVVITLSTVINGDASNPSKGKVVATGNTGYVGGIIGRLKGSYETIESSNYGSITANNVSETDSTGYIGGIIGHLSNTFEIGVNGSIINGSSGYIESEANFVGGIIGYANAAITSKGLISNVANIVGAHYVGGIIGYANSDITFQSNITNSGAIMVTGNRIGGIIGYANKTTTMVAATNSGVITGGGTSQDVGGIIGYANEKVTATGALLNKANIKASNNIGGIIGTAMSTMELYTLTNEATLVEATSTEKGFVGGIIGSANDNVKVSANMINRAEVSAKYDYVGGAIGQIIGNLSCINAYNYGVVETEGSYVGGIVGFANSRAAGAYISIDVTSSMYNEGNVTGKDYVGGIAGSVYGTLKAVSIENEARTVTANGTEGYVGGVVGSVVDCTVTSVESQARVSAVRIQNTGDITNYGCVGGVIGYAEGNVTIRTASISETIDTANNNGPDYLGGFFGKIDGNLTVNTNLENSDTNTIKGRDYVGGIVGYVGGNVQVQQAISFVSIRARSYVGGIIGCAMTIDGAPKTITIGQTINGSDTQVSYGNISVSERDALYVGGIIGYVDGAVEMTSDAYNYGKITAAYTDNVGGIIGYAKDTVTVLGSARNFAEVQGQVYVAGVIGYADNNITVSGSAINQNKVKGSYYVAGIVAYAHDVHDLTFYEITNSGNIEATGKDTQNNGYVGGIIGCMEGSLETGVGRTVLNTGNIKAKGNYVGGIIAYSSYNNAEIILKGIVRNEGTIESEADYIGGIIGGLVGSATKVTMESTVNNEGSITSTGRVGYVGGIIAYINGNNAEVTISSTVKNSANISSAGRDGYVAGIIAYVGGISSKVTISSSVTNEGTITSSGDYVAGIVATIEGNNSQVSITGSVNNTNNVTSSGNIGYVAGVFGKVNGSYNVKVATNSGIVTSNATTSKWVAGILAYTPNAIVTGVGYTYTNTGDIIANNSSFVAGIFGQIDNANLTLGGNITNTDNTVSGKTYVAVIVGKCLDISLQGTVINGTQNGAVGSIVGTDDYVAGIVAYANEFAIVGGAVVANHGSVT